MKATALSDGATATLQASTKKFSSQAELNESLRSPRKTEGGDLYGPTEGKVSAYGSIKPELSRLPAITVPQLLRVDSQEAEQKRFLDSLMNNNLSQMKAAVIAGAQVNKAISKHAGFPLAFVAEHAWMHEGLKFLLEAGADPNLGNEAYGPLSLAVMSANLEGVKALLAAGADPYAAGEYANPFKLSRGLKFHDGDGKAIYELFAALTATPEKH